MLKKIFASLMIVTMLFGATAILTGCDVDPGKEIDLSNTEGDE